MDARPELAPAGSVRRQLVVLVRLQALDRERDRSRQLIEQAERLIGQRKALVDAAAADVARAQEELKRARMTAHEREVDLRSRSDEVRKLELQLNTARTNQEYHALQGHIQRLKDEASRQEDETLGLYDQIEALQHKVAATEERKKRTEAEYVAYADKCRAECAEAAIAISAAEAPRAALMEELPPEIQATYERLRAARDLVAVVALEDRCCGGCGLKLTNNDVARLLGAKEIIYCDSCQRVMFAPLALGADLKA